MSKFKRRKNKYEHHRQLIELLSRSQDSAVYMSKKDNKYPLCQKLTSKGAFKQSSVNNFSSSKKNKLSEFSITNKGIRILGACIWVLKNQEKSWSNADRYDRDQKYCLWMAIPAAIAVTICLALGAGLIYKAIFGLILFSTLLASLENACCSSYSNHKADTCGKQFKDILS